MVKNTKTASVFFKKFCKDLHCRFCMSLLLSDGQNKP